jgi:glycosyltransferase involved in cell wall biosynthesis
MPVLYRMASLLVYPSRYEGFGFPPLEAMASGTPVVCTSAASVPEVVGNGALLFSPDSPRQCADALKTLLCTGKAWEEMRDKGLLQAQKFSWTRCAEETLEVYREIAENV